jgi:hypothetical protein
MFLSSGFLSFFKVDNSFWNGKSWVLKLFYFDASIIIFFESSRTKKSFFFISVENISFLRPFFIWPDAMEETLSSKLLDSCLAFKLASSVIPFI